MLECYASIISSSSIVDNDRITFEINFSEDFITKYFQICLLIIINRNEDNSTLRKKLFSNPQSSRHEGEPLGVAVAVLGVDVGVVVDEVFVASIVRWIDVDHIDFAGVGVGEGGEGFEIVALDYDMVW